jgi:hypothetical protein
VKSLPNSKKMSDWNAADKLDPNTKVVAKKKPLNGKSKPYTSKPATHRHITNAINHTIGVNVRCITPEILVSVLFNWKET